MVLVPLKLVSISGALCCLCFMMACKRDSSPSATLKQSQIEALSSADSVKLASYLDESSPLALPDACEILTMKQVVSHFPEASSAHIDNRRKEHSTTCTYTWNQANNGEYSIALTLQKTRKDTPGQTDLISQSGRLVWIKDSIVYSLTISDNIDSTYLTVIRSGLK